MTSTHLAAIWNNADAMTRSRKVGAQMVISPGLKMIKMSGIADAKGPFKILDNGCGDAMAAQLLWDSLSDASKAGFELVCGDQSPVMVKLANDRIQEGGWPSAKAIVMDMQDMKGLSDSSFTHCFSNFAIQFPPNPDVVLRELKRVCQPNAVIGLTSWKTVGWTSYVREAVARLPDCPAFPDDDTMFAKIQHGNKWQTDEFVKTTLESNGFTDIQIEDSLDEQTLPAAVFATTFGGFIVKAMVAMFWSAEAIQEFAGQGQIEGAMVEYLRDQKLEEVTFDNVAIVAVARTPAK